MLTILKKYTKWTAAKVKKVRCAGAPGCNETSCGHYWRHIRDEIPEIDCRGGVCMTFDKKVYCEEVEDA